MEKSRDGRETALAADERMIFALDIGTRSVIGVVCVMRDEKMVILGSERLEYAQRAMHDGQIENIEQVGKCIRMVKESLEEALGVTLKETAIAAAGRALKTKKVAVERKLNAAEVITDDTIRHMEMEAIEQAQAYILQENDERRNFYCVGHTILGYTLDGYDMAVVKGHYGSVCLMNMIAAFLPKSVVESLYSAVETAGLEVQSLTLEPIAAMNVVIPQEVRMLNLALVDIGAGTSDIAISKAGEVVAYDMVTVAGDEITEAFMQQYLVDFDTAEQMKRSLMELRPIKFVDILGFEQEITRDEVIENAYQTVKQLTEIVSQKILQLNEAPPTALFLVGGGSMYPGLDALFAEALGMEVRRIAIGGGSRLPKVVADISAVATPEYITPLGIALTASMEEQYQFTAVTVNGKKIRQFRYEGLKIADALILSGHYRYEQLNGYMGKRLRFELDGKVQNIAGGLAKPAAIFLNNAPADLETPVHPGDAIMMEPAQSGEDAARTVAQVAPGCRQFTVLFEGMPYTIGKWLTRSGVPLQPEDAIEEGDKLYTQSSLTLGDLLTGLHLQREQAVWVNGKAAKADQLLQENDKITLTQHSAGTNILQPSEPQAEAMPQQPRGALHIVLNEQALTLQTKESGEAYMLFDLFNYVDQNLFEQNAQVLKCEINHIEQPFTTILQEGDQIHIG